jgi:sirohydrochlorin ferrochelatase
MAGTLILATHGVAGGPGSAAEHAQAIRAHGGWAQVRVGCLKAAPSLADALADAPEPVTVVPLLMSEGVIHGILRRQLCELAPQGGWCLTAPVGENPRLADLVLARADALRRRLRWCRCETALLLVGHGTPRHSASAQHAYAMARLVNRHGFAAVGCALLEEPPFPAPAAAALAGAHVIAVGLFLDDGPHGDADVRTALASVAKPVAYAGAIGADAALVPLILAEAAAVQ